MGRSQAALFSEVSENLSSLRAGQRAWFWFCPELDDEQPLMVVRSFQKPPSTDAIRDALRALSLPLGGSLCSGVMSVTPDGTLRMGGPGLSGDHLGRLSRWVSHNVTTHPSLARLRDATLVDVGPGGVVRGQHTDPSLWRGIPALPVRGGIAETASRIDKIKPGLSVWFWMSTVGPGGASFLSLGLERRDPDGTAFARQVTQIRRQLPKPHTAPTSLGVMRALADGSLVLTTRDDAQAALEILHALLADHGEQLARLSGARVVQMDGEQIVTSRQLRPTPVPDLSHLDAGLAALQGNQPVWFWFCPAHGLLLDADRGTLRAAASERNRDGAPSLNGQAKRSPKGWVEFRTRRPLPGFITALAGWVAQHEDAHPSLSVLRLSRMTHRDDSGQVIARQRDDDAWAAT